MTPEQRKAKKLLQRAERAARRARQAETLASGLGVTVEEADATLMQTSPRGRSRMVRRAVKPTRRK